MAAVKPIGSWNKAPNFENSGKTRYYWIPSVKAQYSYLEKSLLSHINKHTLTFSRTFCSSLDTFYSLLVTFCSFVQITVKQNCYEPQRNGLTITKFRHRYFLCKFLWDFGKILWKVVFKVFSTCKTIFKVNLKLKILLKLITLWCLYCNIRARFYLLSCTWRVRSSRLEDFYKKGVLKNSTNSQDNICSVVSFAIKLQAEGLQLY